jgi:hypothetical protein
MNIFHFSPHSHLRMKQDSWPGLCDVEAVQKEVGNRHRSTTYNISGRMYSIMVNMQADTYKAEYKAEFRAVIAETSFGICYIYITNVEYSTQCPGTNSNRDTKLSRGLPINLGLLMRRNSHPLMLLLNKHLSCRRSDGIKQ